MASTQKHHHELTNGVGKCSVPMWSGSGCPAGFCDEPAYGKRPECQEYRDASGRLRRTDGRYEGYVPGLACPGHGGPQKPKAAPDEIRIVFDGPPGPEAGRFVEVEDTAGASIGVGRWVERADGLWELQIPGVDIEAAKAAARAERETAAAE